VGVGQRGKRIKREEARWLGGRSKGRRKETRKGRMEEGRGKRQGGRRVEKRGGGGTKQKRRGEEPLEEGRKR
jgi:hypothetical protein